MVIIALIAAFLARDPSSSVFRVVSFAWAGFGAAVQCGPGGLCLRPCARRRGACGAHDGRVAAPVAGCPGADGMDRHAVRRRGVCGRQGVLFLTPHMGCFEVTAQGVAQRYGPTRGPITVLYRPARQAWLAGVMERSRQRPGLDTAPTTLAGVRQMIKATHGAGRAIGLLPDQVPPDGMGQWAPFFGRPAYTMTLGARLACRPAPRCCWSGASACRGGGVSGCISARCRRRWRPRWTPPWCRSTNGAPDSRVPRAVFVGLRALQATPGRDRRREGSRMKTLGARLFLAFLWLLHFVWPALIIDSQTEALHIASEILAVHLRYALNLQSWVR